MAPRSWLPAVWGGAAAFLVRMAAVRVRVCESPAAAAVTTTLGQAACILSHKI